MASFRWTPKNRKVDDFFIRSPSGTRAQQPCLSIGPKRTDDQASSSLRLFLRKPLVRYPATAGLLARLALSAFPSELTVAYCSKHVVRLTAAGTAPDSHRIPYYPLSRCKGTVAVGKGNCSVEECAQKIFRQHFPLQMLPVESIPSLRQVLGQSRVAAEVAQRRLPACPAGVIQQP